MEEEFYVLVDLDNHEYLQISGETTKHITGALKFADKRTVLEELKTLDEPEKFVCYKVKASYWFERESLGDEK